MTCPTKTAITHTLTLQKEIRKINNMLAYHKYHSKKSEELAIIFITTKCRDERFDSHEELCRRIGNEKTYFLVERMKKVLEIVS